MPEGPDERLDIFIGGAWDHRRGYGVLRSYAARYAAETGRRVAYFRNARCRQVLDLIRQANARGGAVNLVGHSFGGTDAYNVAVAAAKEGLRIDNLITIDPVGGGFGLARRRPGAIAVGRWTNVTGAPQKPNRNDRIARLGGKPSQLPVADADPAVAVDANHEDVDAMMAAGARDVLDGSHRAANNAGAQAAAEVAELKEPPSSSREEGWDGGVRRTMRRRQRPAPT
jgi:thioesterase domain-containing protein